MFKFHHWISSGFDPPLQSIPTVRWKVAARSVSINFIWLGIYPQMQRIVVAFCSPLLVVSARKLTAIPRHSFSRVCWREGYSFHDSVFPIRWTHIRFEYNWRHCRWHMYNMFWCQPNGKHIFIAFSQMNKKNYDWIE